MRVLPLLLSLLFLAGPTSASVAEGVRQLSPAEAGLQDAERYAARFNVTLEEARFRLDQQQASVAVTERLRVQYRDRVAAIVILHQPRWEVVVRLTGSERPADFTAEERGLPISVRFVSGALSTRAAALKVLDAERSRLPELVPGYRGAGIDPASGGLVIIQRPSADLRPRAEAESELSARLGLPVRLRRLEAVLTNSAAIGGGRVEGASSDGRRWRCTTGFVVRNGAGNFGITTAAHCPDTLTWRGPTGEERLLPMVGSWGSAEHDIQIHTGAGLPAGEVFSDSTKTVTRPVTSWATRPMTRPGDWLCLRGESSGYACSEVELTDFAPPGELCGGLCAASWVTVAGPNCRRGDSGAPVFAGTIAYGVLKGGAYYAGEGQCAFYYYQSVDYLPGGWRLVTAR